MVAVVALGPEVAVVTALAPRVAVVVVLDEAGPVAAGSVMTVVAGPPDVSVVAPVDDVVLGVPATANCPPRRNDGGPLWVSL